jgi:hypothetical protein
MTASNWILLGVTAAYAAIAAAAGVEGNTSKAVVFAGYTLANLGLMTW